MNKVIDDKQESKENLEKNTIKKVGNPTTSYQQQELITKASVSAIAEVNHQVN